MLSKPRKGETGYGLYSSHCKSLDSPTEGRQVVVRSLVFGSWLLVSEKCRVCVGLPDAVSDGKTRRLMVTGLETRNSRPDWRPRSKRRRRKKEKAERRQKEPDEELPVGYWTFEVGTPDQTTNNRRQATALKATINHQASTSSAVRPRGDSIC